MQTSWSCNLKQWIFCTYQFCLIFYPLDKQVVDKLQGSGKSKRDGWMTELPRAGLRDEVINKMKDEKQKDVPWQGKCSGTVYVFSVNDIIIHTC